MKKLFLLALLTSFVCSIEVPLTPVQLKKVEQKLQEDAKDYSKFGFSSAEKEEYYKLDIFMDIIQGKDKFTEFDDKAFERMDELQDKLLKAIRAKKAFTSKNNILFRYIQKYPEKTELIKKVIKAGADVNIKDKHGNTPLYYAMQNDNGKIAEILIDAGADIDAKDYSGQTPLVYAAYFNKPNVAEVLLKAGKSPLEEFGKDKAIPLRYAAEQMHKNILYLFLDYGVKREKMIFEMKKSIHTDETLVSEVKKQIAYTKVNNTLKEISQTISNKTHSEMNNKSETIKLNNKLVKYQKELEEKQNLYCIEPELKSDEVCKSRVP